MLFSEGPSPTIDVDVDTEGGAGSLSPDEAQVQRLEAKLAELRTRYGPAHPEVRRTQNEINQLKKKIASVPSDPSGAGADQKPAIQPARTSTRNPVIQAQIAKLDEEIKDLSTQVLPLQKQIESHTARLAEMPVFEQKISRLQQDSDSLRKEYGNLLDKKQAADMSYALEIRQKAEKFVVLDAAETPQKPAAPNRPLINLAGLIAGLALGTALATAVEMGDETVRSESEATRILGKPILSGIPHLVSGQERKLAWFRAAGMLAGTVIGSLALGLLASFVAGRFF
jgi:uncharacterized protein involved in exopolysaccharide biosynthesis